MTPISSAPSTNHSPKPPSDIPRPCQISAFPMLSKRRSSSGSWDLNNLVFSFSCEIAGNLSVALQKSMKHLWSFLLILSLAAEDKVPLPGEQPFKTNCAACHMLASAVVGPSLVALAKTYPKDKQEEFTAWAKTPGKKNTNMIQMPSMAHVPEADLGGIHTYILSVTDGIKEKPGKALYPKFKEPKRQLPYVVRASMPDSSPASVGVVLENGLSVCWDTEACRFRYAYVGNKTNLFSIWRPASLPEKPYFTETADVLIHSATSDDKLEIFFPITAKLQFRGYRLVDKNPEFYYTLGSIEIRELIAAGKDPESVIRRFTVTNVDRSLLFDLSHKGKATLSSDKGILKDGRLTLTAEEAKSFTLTITKK